MNRDEAAYIKLSIRNLGYHVKVNFSQVLAYQMELRCDLDII